MKYETNRDNIAKIVDDNFFKAIGYVDTLEQRKEKLEREINEISNWDFDRKIITEENYWNKPYNKTLSKSYELKRRTDELASLNVCLQLLKECIG